MNVIIIIFIVVSCICSLSTLGYVTADVIQEKRGKKKPLFAEEAPAALPDKAPELTVQAVPAVIAEHAAVTEPAEEISAEESVEEDESDISPAPNGNVVYVKYRRSFLAKLVQSDESLKRRYSIIKNKLLSIKGAKARTSWYCETFKIKKMKLAAIFTKGKTLIVCLPLDPAEYEGSKYSFVNLSDTGRYKEIPFGLKVRSDRAVKYALELIELTAARFGLTLTERAEESFIYPYENDEVLIEKSLIRIKYSGALTDGDTLERADITAMLAGMPRSEKNEIKIPIEIPHAEHIDAEEADVLLPDETAMELAVTESGAGTGRRATINIGVIDRHFDTGELVTLATLKEKGLITKSAGRLKVLAHGILNKPLTVKAESFSVQAIKMIELTGGTVIILKD